MEMFNKGEKIIIEGKVGVITNNDSKNGTVDIEVNGKQYKGVPYRLILARRLPELKSDLMIGKVVELNSLSGVFKCKIIEYRNQYDFDIEIIETLQKETDVFVDFGVFTGKRIYNMSRELLKGCLPPININAGSYADVDKNVILENGDAFAFNPVLDYYGGNFVKRPLYKDVYVKRDIARKGKITSGTIEYFISNLSSIDGKVVISTDKKCTSLKEKEGSIKTYLTKDLWYGGTSRACTEKDYKDGRRHYRNLRVMTKNGKFGYVSYVFNDGTYLIQLDDNSFVEERDFYITDGRLHVGDIYYSVGGEALIVTDKDGTLMSTSGQVYAKQDYKDVVLGKVGRKSSNYTEDTLKNRIGQNITITEYNDDSKVSIKFDSGKEMKNIQMYSVLNGIKLDGGFTYDAKDDVVMCGNFASPEVVDYDTVQEKYIVKAGNRFGTPDFIKSLEIKNDASIDNVLSVNTGDTYLQECLLNAKVIGGWNDNNLMVQLQNGIRIYNVNKSDLVAGTLGVGNNAEALDMLDIYKLYEQSDGSLCQIVSKSEDICDAIVYKNGKGSLKQYVSLSDVYNGMLIDKLEQNVSYKNKLGMNYTVKLIKDDKAYVLFDDNKSTCIVSVNTNSDTVYPDYFDGDKIGNIEGIKFDGLDIVDESLPQFNSYKFTGTCSKCNETVSGDAIELKGHRCKKQK